MRITRDAKNKYIAWAECRVLIVEVGVAYSYHFVECDVTPCMSVYEYLRFGGTL